jgi:hypothetical protein
MPSHIYANGQEIASKSTDGVASTSFPDPCWSPPSPSAGPILIPYGNTAFPRDITNGTQTVFIQGKTIAIEDKAYFSTSTGNEPATYAFAKGLRTGVIKGKAYFRSWSMNVSFEGLGVDRHTDSVSHNHGSMPSNTPVFPYLSRGFFGGHDCEDEEKRIDKACQPEKKRSETQNELKKKSKLAALLQKLRPKNKGRRDANGWHWTDDHCDGLGVPLPDAAAALEFAKDFGSLASSLPDELDAMSILESYLKDMVINAASKAALKVAAKAAAKQLVGSSVPAVGNAVMAIWSVVDAAVAIGDVAEIKAAATEALEQLSVLREKANEIQKMAEDFKNFDQLPPEEQLKKAQEIGADGQDMLATLNACTRARKCNLVPYGKDGLGNPFNARGKSKVESSKGGGCCHGQTGHHLIYGAMAKDGACPNYDHGAAPTVCTEGTTQHVGSHGRVHNAMDRQVRSLASRGKVSADGTMSVDDAIEAAASSHQAAFPLSKCSKKCIKAQLESYYKQMCRGGRLKAVDKNGNPTNPSGGAGLGR